MSKTLTNLRAATRTYLDEATQADWTDVEVDREVNLAYMKVYSEIVNVYEEYYSTKSITSSVANQQEYDLPDDIYKIRRIEINYNVDNSNSIARKAVPVTMDSVLRDLGNSALGITVYRNPAYYVRGNVIGFIPEPTKSGSSAITLWYIKTISELSNLSVSVSVTRAANSALLVTNSSAVNKADLDLTTSLMIG